MYISKITLTDVRCFRKVVIELGDGHPSLMIAGNNATGKSSLLRSIAMGLCDEASAGGLLRELPGDFIRTGVDEADIRIELTENDDKTWIINTNLKLSKTSNFERVKQTYKLNENGTITDIDNWQDFPWEKLFVVGYGAGLRTDGTEDYDQYFSGDAVYTLFKYSQTLQNPELAWRRLRSIKKVDKVEIDTNISSILGTVLDLDDSSKVVLDPSGIFIEKGDNKIPLGAIGDGYRAITTLILDLLSWQFLIQNKDHKEGNGWKPLSMDEIYGIVLIDEIEKHLHPILQRQIINQLHTKFKNIQFIISTHSALCVSGTADIGEQDIPRYKIFSSFKKDLVTSEIEEREIPRGLRYDQILVDYFNLPTTINIKLQQKVDTLRELLMKPKRTDTDEEQLKSLAEELRNEAPLLAEREMDRQEERETRELIEKLRNQLIRDGLIDDKN